MTLMERLTPSEAQQLAELEGYIRGGLHTYIGVGQALQTIRDGRLYRETDRTWGDYVERVWGFSRQRAHQLMEAADTHAALSTVVDVQNEREARELKGAAQIVAALDPEMQRAVAQYLKSATGTDRPTTAQVKAAAEVAQAIDLHGTVQHPDNGEEVPFASLTGEQRATTLAENVSQGTHERLMRQKMHQQASVLDAKSNGRGGWADLPINYAMTHLTSTQELRITIRHDGTAQAAVLDAGTVIATGQAAPYLKAAVLNLMHEVKGV